MNFLSKYEPSGNISETDFVIIVDGLTSWIADHFTARQRAALVEALTDPDRAFASESAAGMIEAIVEKLKV